MQLMCYKVLYSWVVMATTREGSCKRHVTYTLSFCNYINILPHEKMDYGVLKSNCCIVELILSLSIKTTPLLFCIS